MHFEQPDDYALVLRAELSPGATREMADESKDRHQSVEERCYGVMERLANKLFRSMARVIRVLLSSGLVILTWELGLQH